MARKPGDNRFGEYLKALRARASLPLRAVADASRGIDRKIGDPISNGYLSMLELGRSRAVTLRKLVTLATIYCEPLDRLIAEAPPELRHRLIAERDASPAHSSLPTDEPPDTSVGVEDALYAWFEDVLRAAAVTVAVPLGRERPFMRSAREAMSWVLLPALIRQGGAGNADAFWRDASARYRLVFVGRPSWEQVAEDARRWYINREDARDSVQLALHSWSLDGPRKILTCRLNRVVLDLHPGLPRAGLAGTDELAVEGVPMRFAAAIRRAQAVEALASRVPDRLQLPATPGVFAAARRYIVDELAPFALWGRFDDLITMLDSGAALARFLSGRSRPPDGTAPELAFDPSACSAFVHRAESLRILEPLKSAEGDESPPANPTASPAPPGQAAAPKRRTGRGRKRGSPGAAT